jgi:ABC-2 type transport system permease protein
MKNFFFLLYPKWQSAQYVWRKDIKRYQALVIGFLGLLCMLGCWYGGYYLFAQIFQIDLIAMLLVQKLIYFVLESLSWILVFSTVLAAFSTHYLSQDLSILVSAPISVFRLFLNKTIEAWLQSSWMMLVFVFPFLCSLAWYIDLPWYFFLFLFFALLILTLLCAFLACGTVVLLARFFPAKRLQESLVVVTVLAFIYLYARFHASRPDRFFREDGFQDLLALIKGLNTLGSEEHWFQFSNLAIWTSNCIYQTLVQPLNPISALPHFALLLGVLGTLVVATLILAYFWYFPGYWLAQEGIGQGQQVKFKDQPISYPNTISLNLRTKETKLFWRNHHQWTQLLLVGSLVVVYIFNFKYFNLLHSSGFFSNYTLFYMHLGLSGMILITISARFLYPSISQEGKAIWILQSAPISVKSILYAKILWFAKPLFVFAVLLCTTAVYLTNLGFAWFLLMLWSEILLIIGILGLAVGMGAMTPRFDLANPMQISSSFGGMAFMLVALFYLVCFGVSWHWIVYQMVIYQEQLFDQMATWKLVLSVLVSHGMAILFFQWPIRLGIRKLETLWVNQD